MTTLIKERYELLEVVGAGGEGRVVKALDRQHGRFVALKIRPVWSDRARDELLSEARILLTVPPHPALPLVREDFFDGEDYLIAMDWVDGTDLATLLRDRGRPGLAPSSVLAYLAQAAEALTHLHLQTPPVIHGDVKPANLILTKGGRVKLVDFGISSAPTSIRRRSGTPAYRAPELAADGIPSRGSDIYALAATAFALLSGSAPAGVLPSWEGIESAQAQRLEAAIRRGMATDPSRRPATPGELIELLRAGWAETLPTGVVTFCLSDIKGAATMWDTDPAAMAEALVRHDELIADCVEAHGGRLLKSMREGESTVSVFHSARAALIAAIASAQACAAESWPGGLEIAPRVGLHTGEAERRGADYLGPSIGLAARLRAQADGGQISLPSVTTDLVDGQRPPGCELLDLGLHRFHGEGAPDRIYAVKAPGVGAPAPATECPYRGLPAFEPEDRAYFFGREQVVDDLLARLAAGSLVALVGPSGSGKSSVLRAGVIAAARAGEIAGIERARLLTPGASPRLEPAADGAELIVVDQFEELFTLCDDRSRRQIFLDALLAARGPVAIGVRADIYGQLAEHPALARAVAADHVLLGAMSDEELERAVKEPSALAGLQLEPGLVELALRDVSGEPGALPLLSHALRATWERRDGRTLTVEAYRDSGGAGAPLAHTADSVIASLSPDRQRIARNLFLRLIELGEGTADTRRRVAIDELVPDGVLPETVGELLAHLADARLVTVGEGTAELAHEVLIREWPTLRGWLDDDREGIRLHRQVGAAARLWDTGGRDRSDVYRGSRLAAAADWAVQHRNELNATEREFLNASLEEADRDRRAHTRINRRLRGLLAGAVALLVVAVLAGTLALIQRSHAQAQALTSDAELLGAQAQTEPNLDRAMLLAVAGVKLQNRVETRSDLLAALQRSPALIRVLRPSRREIAALAVSPGGRLLAVADTAGVVRLIDLASWRPAGRAVQLPGTIAPQAMTFSPDGSTLLVVIEGAARSELDAIDVASRGVRRIQTWPGLVPAPPTVSAALADSPDGSLIAVSLITQSPTDATPSAERLLLLDAATGRTRWQHRYPMRPGQLEPYLAFTPGGTLVSSAQQGETILWNPHTGRVLRRFPIGGEPAISPDGAQVALALNSRSLATPNSSIALLDLRTARTRSLSGQLPGAWIRSIAFTPDGARIVAGALDAIHVWDVGTGEITDTYAGQPGRRAQVTVDPYNSSVISGAQDGSVAAFDLSGTRRLGRFFSWNTPDSSCGNSPCAVVNQHGTMATDQADGTVALVDLHTLRLTRTLPARDGTITNAIAFVPDGRTLVTGGTSGHVTFWDVGTGRTIRTLRVSQPVYWAAVSPDGRLLAVQTQAANGSDSHVDILQIKTGNVLQSHVVRHGYAGIEFSRDGRELVARGCCASGSTVVAWDTHTGLQLFSRNDGQDTTTDLTPDSRILAVGTEDGRVLLLNAHSGRPVSTPIQAAAGHIIDVKFSPDGSMFALGSNDGTASLWDLRSRKRIGNPFPQTAGAVPDVVFEPNGRVLFLYLSNAYEWPTDLRTWVRFACQIAGRDLTRQEWHDLLPARPYQHVCSP